MWWFIKVTFTHVMMLHSTVRFKENLPLTIYSKSKETDTHLPDRTWLLSVEKQHIRRPMVGATPDLTCLKMKKKRFVSGWNLEHEVQTSVTLLLN